MRNERGRNDNRQEPPAPGVVRPQDRSALERDRWAHQPGRWALVRPHDGFAQGQSTAKSYGQSSMGPSFFGGGPARPSSL